MLLDIKQRQELDRALTKPLLFFFFSSSIWFFISIFLALLSFIQMNFPEAFSLFSILPVGRVYSAHWNAFIYGWALQLSFGVMIWVLCRLSGKKTYSSFALLVLGVFWNLFITVACVAILLGMGRGIWWLDFPSFIWIPFLLSFFLPFLPFFLRFLAGIKQKSSSVEAYLFFSLFSFFCVISLVFLFLEMKGGHPLMKAGMASWYRWVLLYAVFIPLSFGFLRFFVSKICTSPFNKKIFFVSFPFLVIFAFCGGMQWLHGSPLPLFLSHLGMLAMAMIAIPLVLEGGELISIFQKEDAFSKSTALRFFFASAICLVSLGFVNLLISIPSFWISIQLSLFTYGYPFLVIYGCLGMALFGSVYYIVPRLLNTEWISQSLVRVHFWFSVYALAFMFVFCSLLGGFQQGDVQFDWRNLWSAVVSTSSPYIIGFAVAWFLLLVAHLLFFIHLVLVCKNRKKNPSSKMLILEHPPFENPHGQDQLVEN